MSQPYLHRTLNSYGKPVKVLGQGSYGRVDMYQKDSGETFAVKFDLDGFSDAYVKETSMLISLLHPNVAHAIDAGIDMQGNPYVVMKVATMSGQDVMKQAFSKEQYKSIFFQMALGVAYLTSRGIIHRDIKPANTLLRDMGDCYNVRIADFGLTNPVYCYGTESDTIAYTAIYRPIEVILGDKNYTVQADVWALGVAFNDMFTRTYLFRKMIKMDPADAVIKVHGLIDVASWPEVVNLPHWNSKYQSPSAIPIPTKMGKFDDLISKMLTYNPQRRITIYDVLKHPYFAKVRSYSTSRCIQFESIPKQLSCSFMLKKIELSGQGQNLPWSNRRTLFDWMIEVMQSFSNVEHLFLSFVILDQYYSMYKDKNENIMKTSCVAMLLSSQFLELGIKPSDMVYITGNAFTKEELILQRNRMFKVLGYNLYVATPYHYLPITIQRRNKTRDKRGTSMNVIWYLYLLYRDVRHLSFQEMVDLAVSLEDGTVDPDNREIIQDYIKEPIHVPQLSNIHKKMLFMVE